MRSDNIRANHMGSQWMTSEGASTEPSLEPIRFGRAICGALAEAERREWWIANGRGGYAARTIAGTLTRRYHGLLIAPIEPPLGRRLVFAKADATLRDGANRYPLFTNRWGGGQIVPPGCLGIESFHLDHSIPVWTYAVGGRRIEARIWMEPGENMVWLAWYLHSAVGESYALSLQLTLLVNNRDHHGETWEDSFQPTLSVAGDTLHVTDGTRFTLSLRAPDGTIAPRRDWYHNFDLPVEAERGLGSHDSHLCIGQADLPLHPGVWCGLVASLRPNPPNDVTAALQRRLAHDRQVLAEAMGNVAPIAGAITAHRVPPWINRLTLAAEAFLFARPLPEE